MAKVRIIFGKEAENDTNPAYQQKGTPNSFSVRKKMGSESQKGNKPKKDKKPSKEGLSHKLDKIMASKSGGY